MEDNICAQDNELLALGSILDEHQFKVTGRCGHIKAHPQLPSETITLKVQYDALDVTNCHQISFLPPLALKFKLPTGYPSETIPEFSLSCVWLTNDQISILSNHLKELWEKSFGSEILYEWYQFLSDETFSSLEINNELSVGKQLYQSHGVVASGETVSSQRDETMHATTSNDTERRPEILMVLLVYNKMKEEEKFQSSVFTCNICFEGKLGSKCSLFKVCKHVYCKDCLSSYFEILITEGSVKALKCPEEKCTSQALPHQVKQLVNNDLYLRYERLLLQTTLDTMSDIIYCPLSHCQSPVILDQNENLAQCPSCSYAFCVFCKSGYHGVTPCRLTTGEIKKLCEEYRNANPERRAEMEKKYGVEALTSVEYSESADTQENPSMANSQEWLDKYAKTCPGCRAFVEKIDGCNQMTCSKCGTYFCWLCERAIPSYDPDQHFRGLKYDCNR
uniref:RBR-type E3 ubiquitin transferase n=1 Tax=Phallusia mammillata TaxID=59560 RepID=A0A6F9DR88_9ASCI|nr:ZF(RING/C6HC)-7 Zn-finger (RING/cysteine-rich C6HC)-7 [Phallusia mammillata]